MKNNINIHTCRFDAENVEAWAEQWYLDVQRVLLAFEASYDRAGFLAEIRGMGPAYVAASK